MKPSSFRTDLAMETTEIFKDLNEKQYPSGVEVEEIQEEFFTTTTVHVTSQEGALSIGKPIGNYITIEVPDLTQDTFSSDEAVSKKLSQELQKLFPETPLKTVLVIGLGNWHITSDSLGPKVISKTYVTRHIYEYGTVKDQKNLQQYPSLCALSPGVLGLTGIETFEIVKGVLDHVNPCLILVVDALASRKASRVSNTIQIADTGITPGSGVGNRRLGLSQETLGRPVIALGVPTVIDAATLSTDALEMLLEELKNHPSTQKDAQSFQQILNYENLGLERLLERLITPHSEKLIVTPKDIDETIDRVSSIIADGIHDALLPQKERLH